MREWITIQEAVRLSGKSATTIRTAVKQATSKTDIKRSKSGIKSGIVKDSRLIAKQEKLGSRFIYLIDKVSLLKCYPPFVVPQGEVDSKTDINPVSSGTRVDIKLYSTLLEQLQEKDRQIASLHERIKEMNFIIQGLRQDNRLLTSGKNDDQTIDAESHREEKKPESWSTWLLRKVAG